MDSTTLKKILSEEMTMYAGLGANSVGFSAFDEERQNYAVGDIDYADFPTVTFLTVRIVDDKVVIEEDATDKPLVDALMQRGVPREQIILAYNGETAPEIEVETWMPQS